MSVVHVYRCNCGCGAESRDLEGWAAMRPDAGDLRVWRERNSGKPERFDDYVHFATSECAGRFFFPPKKVTP